MSSIILASSLSRFSCVDHAIALTTSARTTRTDVANLCGGVDFYPVGSGISCTGARFLWWNNGSTSRTIQARLYVVNSSTPTLVASNTRTITADGEYEINWTAVSLTPSINRLYRLFVGPNDGSLVWSYYTHGMPSASLRTVAPRLLYSAWTYNNTGGGGTITSDIGSQYIFPVDPILLGV